MGRRIVYVVITDTNYILPRILWRTEGWDYVCFTDKNLKSEEWEIVKFSGKLDPKRLSRKPKILYHEYVNDYDVSIYLDSKFIVRIDLDGFVEKRLGQADMAVMSHNKRTCIYQEAKLLKRLKLDSEKVISRQINKYQKEGFAPLSGLYAPGITIRRHGSKQLEKCMELWFNELLNNSHRDVLSFPYAIWKVPINLAVMPWNEVYRLFHHKGKRIPSSAA